MRLPRFKALAATLPAIALASQSAGSPEIDLEISFQDHVLPILEEHCYDCHGDGASKGDVALDKHLSMEALIKDRSLWKRVMHNVEVDVMPPASRKFRPTEEEIEILLAWIGRDVFKYDCDRPDPGRVTIRRLNRNEYANTIRDLIGVQVNPQEELLPDDTGYGFDNIGDVLSLSPILFEKYMKLADEVLDEALLIEDPALPSKRYEANELEGGEQYGEDKVLATNGSFTLHHDVAEAGAYVIQIEASSTPAGDDPASMAVRIDHQKAAVTFDVERPREDPGIFRHEVRLKEGNRRIDIAFLNDLYDPSVKDPERRDRNLYVRSVTIEGPLRVGPPVAPEFQRQLFSRYASAFGKPHRREMNANQIQGGERQDGWIQLWENESIHTDIQVPAADHYRIRVFAAQSKAGPENARMSLAVDQELRGTKQVAIEQPDASEYVFETWLSAGKRRLSLAFENDYFDEESGEDRNLHVKSVAVERRATPNFGRGIPEARRREVAREMIRGFGRRVFRRPLRDEELSVLTEEIFATGSSAGGDYAFEQGLHAAFTALMTSPSFLFRGETQPEPNSSDGNHLIDEWSLATRLAYFLWSSTPDDQLLDRAAQGNLREHLREEVDRMLKDSRSDALVTNFASQWLQIRDVVNVERSRRRFRGFSIGIAHAMQMESEALIRHMMTNDLPVTELLTADYTFLNERLAKFYDIGGVEGEKFQRVALNGQRRGGILAHGSILTLTSNPTRTSPVKRGKWILENILGTPPPEAPPDVPNLDESREKAGGGGLRQQLEIHRDNPNCSSCHALMDPIGFAFENYSAVGQWRTKDGDQPIDASGQLVTGEKFEDSVDLSRILIEHRRDQFLRCMSERILTYALGRGVEFYDKCALDEIVKKINAKEARFTAMIHAVVASVPFQYRRGEGERNYD
ncbi:MAG: DUF1592 domain-containing protein [Verrucomicrobiota bacterium]